MYQHYIGPDAHDRKILLTDYIHWNLIKKIHQMLRSCLQAFKSYI